MRAADRFSVPAALEVLPAVCPVSGLPVRTRPEWVYTNPEKTYRVTIALIGDAIFWVIPRGYITEADMTAATAMAAAIKAETHPGESPFVFIENFAHTRGGTAPARRLYLRFTNTLHGLLGSFPYGMPPFFRFSFNFSRRLHLHRYRVHMVARYDDAVRSALDLLRRHGISPAPSDPVAALPLSGISVPLDGGEPVTDSASSAYPESVLMDHVHDLLAHLCALDLESPGAPDPPHIARQSPMQPVYDALLTLKMDMDRFLAEHYAIMANLEIRHTQLIEKTAAIEARNRELQTLLQKSSEDQAALGKVALLNIENLLKPLLRLIERDARSPLQHGWLKGLNSSIDDLSMNLFPRLDLRHYQLTPRELRIARLIREGRTSGAIARQLGISIRTVESFRRRLREKLGIRGRPRNLRTVLLGIPDG